MARPIPYMFCRYMMSVDEEALDVSGQRQFINERQGDFYDHGYERKDRPVASALVMEPDDFEIDDEVCLTWSVGLRPGFRVQQEYDKTAQKLSQTIVDDSHIKFARFLALPQRGIMAIEDRATDELIPARQAIGVLRSVVRSLGDGIGALDVRHGDAADIERWLNDWELKEYSYTISPLNPITHTDLAERRSDAMKRENIGRETGKVQPPEGQGMKVNSGIIEEANDLATVGYGQRGFRGRTPDGHIAHVPKPTFHDNRHKNLLEQQKPQFVRVMFEPSDETEEAPLRSQVAAALRRFYGEQDGIKT